LRGCHTTQPLSLKLVVATKVDDVRYHALTTDKRLLHTVARVITDWAADQTDSLFERKLLNRDEEANALARLIHLCKFESCGMRKGVYSDTPLQQRAFILLQGRMGDTDAAVATPYWARAK